jgi:N-methylhydantoinase A
MTDPSRAPERLHPPEQGAADYATPRSRRAYFGREHGWLDTPIVARAQVGPAAQPGPLIVEEYDATTVVPPDAAIWRDDAGNLRLELR